MIPHHENDPDLIGAKEYRIEDAKKRMKLTRAQEDELCGIIGDWYVDWKGKMTNDRTPHYLGMAKEELKDRICKK